MRPTASRLLTLLAVVVPALLVGGCAMVDQLGGMSTACELRAGGIPAQAEVMAIWETGWTINDDPVIGLRVRVEPLDRAPYEAEIPKALIGILQVPRLQPGQRVPVIFDERDPARVGLDIYPCR